MKKIGCWRIVVALESGSQRMVNDVIGKRLKLESLERVVKICHKIGLKMDAK